MTPLSVLFLLSDRLITFERNNQVLLWKREGYRERDDRFLRLDLDRVLILCYVLTEADSASCNHAFCKYRLLRIFHVFFFLINKYDNRKRTLFVASYNENSISFCSLGPNTLLIYVSSSCELPSTKYQVSLNSFLVAHRFWINFFFTIIQTYFTCNIQYLFLFLGKIYVQDLIKIVIE